VEPVTKGIRIILQFDVEVVGWGAKSTLAVKAKDNNEDEDEEEDEDNPIEDELFYSMENISRKRKRYQNEGSLTADNKIVTKVTNIIVNLLADGAQEVAFAMQHLYQKSSILPEFLKGANAQLYRALVSDFDIPLRPVILQSRSASLDHA